MTNIIPFPLSAGRPRAVGRNLAALERAKAMRAGAAENGWLSLDDICDVAEIAEHAARPHYDFRFTVADAG